MKNVIENQYELQNFIFIYRSYIMKVEIYRKQIKHYTIHIEKIKYCNF